MKNILPSLPSLLLHVPAAFCSMKSSAALYLTLAVTFMGRKKQGREGKTNIPLKISLHKEFWMYRSTFGLYSMAPGNRKCNACFLCQSCLHTVQSDYTLTFFFSVHAFLHRNTVKLLSATTMHILWVVKWQLSQIPIVNGYDLTFACFSFFTFSSKLSHLANSPFWK